MYIIKNITFTNFKCYRGEHCVDFTNKDVVGIVGSYTDVNGRSNWSGKSTFGDVIRYLIFGQCGTPNSRLISWGEESLTVSGTLLNVLTGEEIDIVRTVNEKGKTTVEIGDRDTSKRGQEWLNGVLGNTYKDWLITSFFEQGDTLRFCNMLPSEKRAEIQNWLEKDYWEKARETVKKQLDVYKKELDKQNAILESLNDDTGDSDDDIKRSISEYEKEIVELRRAYEEQQKAINNKKSLERLKGTVRSNMDTFRHDMIQYMMIDGYIEEEYELKNKLKEFKVLETAREELRNIRSKQYALLENIKRRGKECKKKIEESFNGICPLDHNNCPRKDEIDQSEFYKEERNKLVQEYMDADTLLKSIEEEWKDVDSKYMALKSIESQLKEVTRWLNANKKNAPNGELFSNYVKEYYQIEKDLSLVQDDSSLIQYSQISNKEKLVGECNYTLKANKENREKKILANAKIKETAKLVKVYQFLNYAFSKEGIPSTIVNRALDQICIRANRLLRSLGTGLEIRFSFEKVTKTKSDVCYTCGEVFAPKKRKCEQCGSDRPFKISPDLDIEVFVNGSWGPFESQSGGCKTLIATMIRFAVSKMASENGKSKLLVGYIDEVLGSLDPVNKVALAKCLITDNDLGISQRFMVTHEEDIQYMFPHILNVTMNSKNGNSTIDWRD